MTSHGFCGHLVYAENTTFEKVSPADQDLRDKDFIAEFDVHQVWYVGNLFGASFLLDFGGGLAGVDGLGCVPFCDSPGQNETWNAVHTAGAAAGLTETPEEAHENEDGRAQSTHTYAGVKHAPGIVQQETDVWEMDGWLVAFPTERFVGFVNGPGGQPVSEDDLEDHVEPMIGEELSGDTTAQICGYTPDIDFVSTGEQSFCDSPLLYVPPEGAGPDGDGPLFSDYDDECESPTYVCGASGGGYWESAAVGLAAYGGHIQDDYVTWHWVVAPNQPDCGNTQPGFDFDGDGADMPYIAHDVDVYTPATGFEEGPRASVDGADAYAGALTDDVTEVDVPGVPDDVNDAIDDTVDTAEDEVDNQTAQFIKDEIIEPNHVGAEDRFIDDNSRDAFTVDRDVTDDPCEQMIASESPDTVDPWVNLADNTVETNREATATFGTLGGSTAGTSNVGLYGDEASPHDENNDPTTDLYRTDGFFGMFTDKDDDGEYERIIDSTDTTDGFGFGVYQENEIQQVGAYPMLWDMQVNFTDDGEPQVDDESGCIGPGSQPFAQTMDEAGYGPNTGLAQAIYLQESTAFTDADLTDPNTALYPNGNNIYLLLSEAARDIWDGDTSQTAAPLDAEIDAFVEEVREFVVEEQGADGATLEVFQPAEELGLDSGFQSQCDESTGGYTAAVSFAHSCETGCSGDTIATMYAFEVASDDGVLGGGEVPPLEVDGDNTVFGTGMHSWYDIDAFDGDPDRTDQRMDPPPEDD